MSDKPKSPTTGVDKTVPQPSIVSQNSKKVNSKIAPPVTTVGDQDSTAPWVYSDLVKEHFLNPRNFLMGDENQYVYDAVGTVGNPVCGDQMRMFLQIQDGRITDVKWKTYGCASAIASTSALSELIKGKTLDQALAVGPAEIADFLGGLPEHKFHCSVLGHEALAAAIQSYRSSEASSQ